MRIVNYSNEHASALTRALVAAGVGRLLRCEAYVKHMYLDNPCGRLRLLLDDEGVIIATLGTEAVPAQFGEKRYRISVGAATYSLRPNALAFLLHDWLRASDIAVLVPANAGWDSLVAKQKRWQRHPGLRLWFLNWGYPLFEGDPLWKRLVKPSVRFLARVNPGNFSRHIPTRGRSGLKVEEVDEFSPDMVERRADFGFSIDPGLQYLNGRFSTRLDYVRYRIFRIVRGYRTTGCVVLAEWPQVVCVSYCNGDEPEGLALGVLLAVSVVNTGATRYRQVTLSSMHEGMITVFKRFGFRASPNEMSLYVATSRQQTESDAVGRDWLVNLEMGDQGVYMGLFGGSSAVRQTPKVAA